MSQTHRYLVNLVFDPEYRGYVADVPQLPGCMSQGKSVEAALQNVRNAIKACLKATAHSELKRIPEVLTSQVEVRI
ncbi:MAG: type II toxin-antitoxin system HicB family antitoxin [Terriglobia bacterium]